VKKYAGFASAVIVAIAVTALAISYLIPGASHPRMMGGAMGGAASGTGKGMAILLFLIALGAVIVAVIIRPKRKS
jgi:hypothetical protein